MPLPLSIEELLQRIEHGSDRMGLIVDQNPGMLIECVTALGSRPGWNVWSIGLELAEVLRDIRPQDRGLRAEEWTRAAAKAHRGDRCIAIGIDLLFEPSFKLDQLRLFEHIGSICPVVAAWPGDYDEDKLTYARAGHGHYKVWRNPDLPIAVIAS